MELSTIHEITRKVTKDGPNFVFVRVISWIVDSTNAGGNLKYYRFRLAIISAGIDF
jgi:hypothetical protein